MKICFVVHTFDKKDRGGVLRVVSQLANRLIKKYNITIMSFGVINEKAYDLDSEVNLVSLNMDKYNTTYYKGLAKINWFKDANRIIKNFLDLETIWITSSPPISLLFSSLKYRNRNLKVIGCDHTSTLYKKNFFIQKIRNFLLSKLDVMVALTPQDQFYYSSNGINSICIPNGIDQKEINVLDNSRNYLIFVGRLDEEKQPFKAIDFYIASELPQQNVKMKIYGHGNYENQIRKYIREKNFENFIELITGQTNPDIIYKDAFALILTSKIEGFGMVLLEAISRNIPCLSFKISYGPLNIIQDTHNGFFIKEDGSDFNEKIALINNLYLDDISLSISQYSYLNIMKKWESMISEQYE